MERTSPSGNNINCASPSNTDNRIPYTIIPDSIRPERVARPHFDQAVHNPQMFSDEIKFGEGSPQVDQSASRNDQGYNRAFRQRFNNKRGYQRNTTAFRSRGHTSSVPRIGLRRKNCCECNQEEAEYKCPECLKKYCSSKCYKVHKSGPQCVSLSTKGVEGEKPTMEVGSVATKKNYMYHTDDTIRPEGLEKLAEEPLNSKMLEFFKSTRLRDKIKELNGAEHPSAMLDLLIEDKEFADFKNFVVEHMSGYLFNTKPK